MGAKEKLYSMFGELNNQRWSRHIIPMLLTNGKEFGLLYILSYSKLPLSLAKIFAAEVVVAKKGRSSRHVFAPPSGTGLGLTHAEESSENKFWAEIMPGIALADVFIPGAPLDDL